MFEFLFKYPTTVFSKGEFALLSGWPRWVLIVLIVAAAAAIGWRIRRHLADAAPSLRTWRAGVIWLLQSALLALLLLLVWQPAISVAELKPQQNIIAVLMDDSRSMSIADEGAPRQVKAVESFDSVLAELKKKFQVRLYKMDRGVSSVQDFKQLQASAPVTHIGDSLRQFSDETADLPVGAIVLLSDGGENSGGLDREAVSALRNRRIPIHAVGFGKEQSAHDVEINDVAIAPRALADSRLAATVNIHQHGYAGRKAMLRVHEDNKVLAGREITLAADGTVQTEVIPFSAGSAGAKALQFSIDVQDGEENRFNNAVTRLVKVESDARRVLYVEGEPRWEFKFIRRAEDDDRIVQVASILRTTENKTYVQQGTGEAKDAERRLTDGFPAKAEDLFQYQGIILGSVEASYFTAAQQDLIKQFVDRRGGGLLMLGGGRYALGEGGWAASAIAEILPVVLPTNKGTFQRDPATAELTSAGMDSMITRLDEDAAKNSERWKKLPYMMNYQDPGKAKPGAATLLNMTVKDRTMPLLITENYGRGRTAVLATGGTWRWQMSMPVDDQSHENFWRQLLRYLVTDTPGQIITSVPSQTLLDDGRIQISVDVRGKDYNPAADAQVQAHILGPEGIAAQIDMAPDPNTPGVFRADWNAEKPGSYVAEVTAKRGNEELGRDVLNFQRMDGVAENFHTEQNRPLLEGLASQTGGKYWRPQDLSKLSGEISYSEAGITVRDTKELWNMPIVFLMILLLRGGEWLLRRKWGIV